MLRDDLTYASPGIRSGGVWDGALRCGGINPNFITGQAMPSTFLQMPGKLGYEASSRDTGSRSMVARPPKALVMACAKASTCEGRSPTTQRVTSV